MHMVMHINPWDIVHVNTVGASRYRAYLKDHSGEAADSANNTVREIRSPASISNPYCAPIIGRRSRSVSGQYCRNGSTPFASPQFSCPGTVIELRWGACVHVQVHVHVACKLALACSV
jgi:hypothetical protein